MTYDITSKWPQMLVTGQTVTDRDTIIEILLLTDSFLTDTSQYSGGNNHAFNLMYRTKAGLEYVGKFERYIKEFPEGWFWMHSRWRTRPKAEDVSIY